MRSLLALLALGWLTGCNFGPDRLLECYFDCPKAYWASVAENIANGEDIEARGINLVGKVEFFSKDLFKASDRIALFFGKTTDREKDQEGILVQQDGWFYAKVIPGDHVFAGFAGIINLGPMSYSETIGHSQRANRPLGQYWCQFGLGKHHYQNLFADASDFVINVPPGKVLFLGVLTIQTRRLGLILGDPNSAIISQDLAIGDTEGVPNESFRELLARGEAQPVALSDIPCLQGFVGHRRMF